MNAKRQTFYGTLNGHTLSDYSIKNIKPYRQSPLTLRNPSERVEDVTHLIGDGAYFSSYFSQFFDCEDALSEDNAVCQRLQWLADYILAGQRSRPQGLLPRSSRSKECPYDADALAALPQKEEQPPDYSLFQPEDVRQMAAALVLAPRPLSSEDPLSLMLYDVQQAFCRAPLTDNERRAVELLRTGETQASAAKELGLSQSGIGRLLRSAAHKASQAFKRG